MEKRGKSQTKIAGTIGVHKSTVSREIRRNTGGRGYQYKQAHRFAIKRRKCKAKGYRRSMNQVFWRKSLTVALST